MKANPYIYPYVPFNDLSKKTIIWNLNKPQTFSQPQLEKFLKSFPLPETKPKDKTVEEKIFNIFLDKSILYGPKEYALQEKKLWIEKIKYFTIQNKPVLFTIHGFPFKIPNPLKTNRTLPDLGELLSLLKLGSIVKNIEAVYKPGAKITIVGEGGFARISGISEQEWKKYRIFIKKLIKDFNLTGKIDIIDLADLEKEKNFKKTFNKINKSLRQAYKQKDPQIVAKVDETTESILRIVSTRGIPEETLLDLYNDRVNTPKIAKMRKVLQKKALNLVFDYHAFLMTRDALDFVNKKVPHSIPLTVSPKPGRIGVYPIAAHVTRLPYHGVAVYDKAKNRFSVEYLIDLKRLARSITPVLYDQDQEKLPFLYIIG